MRKFNIRLLSILFPILLVCFIFLSTLQFSCDIEKAAAYQINLIKHTMTFVKTNLLIPYISSYIDINETFLSFLNPVSDSRTPVKPISKKEKRGLFTNLYYILSTIAVINKKLLIVLLVTFVGLSCISAKKHTADDYSMRIRSCIKHYSYWVLDFLSPLDKSVQNRSNEYDIERIKDFFAEINRTLNNNIFGVRFFLCTNGTNKVDFDRNNTKKGGINHE